jgi:threonine/homoserine/homoserine lactone efflux protein
MTELAIAALPFFYFLLIAAITPGPNNVMLTASGMNFGYKRTLPHILGIYVGFTVLIMLTAFGIGAAYHAFPQIEIILKTLGSAYLVYLAYKIATAGRLGLKEKEKDATRPLTFTEAAMFQFINPKAVVACLTAISLLPPDLGIAQSILVIFICNSFSCLCSTSTWTVFGKMIAKLFRDDKTRHIINIILALLLLATIPMMVL